MNLTIDITDSVTPALAALRRKLADGQRLLRVIGAAVLPLFQRNFQKMAGTEHNKFGARGGFWNRMMSGTRAEAGANAATIAMPREVALRYYGGTVRPKTAKNLAIPARQEAYGKSPKDFNNLRFAVFHGHPLLYSTDETHVGYRVKEDGKRTKYDHEGKSSIGRKKQGLKIWYWLTPSATVKPNPAVLPAEEEILAAATDGIKDFLENNK